MDASGLVVDLAVWDSSSSYAWQLSEKVSQSHVEQFIRMIRDYGIMPMGLKFLRVSSPPQGYREMT